MSSQKSKTKPYSNHFTTIPTHRYCRAQVVHRTPDGRAFGHPADRRVRHRPLARIPIAGKRYLSSARNRKQHGTQRDQQEKLSRKMTGRALRMIWHAKTHTHQLLSQMRWNKRKYAHIFHLIEFIMIAEIVSENWHTFRKDARIENTDHTSCR